MDMDDGIFDEILNSDEGAVQLSWEIAARCTCYTEDTKQPRWDCPRCGGSGVQYQDPQTVTGLFRSQQRWESFRREGELDHGEASLTTPLAVKPGYADRRVRDRFTVIAAGSDGQIVLPQTLPAVFLDRAFYPAAPAVPFIFAGAQRAWRVQLQSDSLHQELVP